MMNRRCKEYLCPKHNDDRCCYTCAEKHSCEEPVDEACKFEDNSCGFLKKDRQTEKVSNIKKRKTLP